MATHTRMLPAIDRKIRRARNEPVRCGRGKDLSYLHNVIPEFNILCAIFYTLWISKTFSFLLLNVTAGVSISDISLSRCHWHFTITFGATISCQKFLRGWASRDPADIIHEQHCRWVQRIRKCLEENWKISPLAYPRSKLWAMTAHLVSLCRRVPLPNLATSR